MRGSEKRKGGVGRARPRLAFRLLARGAEGCIRGVCCEGEAVMYRVQNPRDLGANNCQRYLVRKKLLYNFAQRKA